MDFEGIEVADSGRVSHEMATRNRGSIIPAERGTMIGRHNAAHDAGGPTGTTGRSPRGSVVQPAEYEFGRTGDMGINDPDEWDCEE